MSEENKNPGKQEDLKAENDFLKMKLMLEHGAVMGGGGNGSEIPPEIENEFLKNVARFEEEWAHVKQVTVFEKIGRPTHFRPVDVIPEDEIGYAWEELSSYLNEHGLQLDACSPNISERELYRFTIEELFHHETEDLKIPGMMTCFIYDEFHPDPVYDTTRMVQDDLLGDIFSKRDLFHDILYDRNGFLFNRREFKDRNSFKSMINHFKSAFDDIDMPEYVTISCEVNDGQCTVKGSYGATATTGGRSQYFRGSFEVKLRKDEYNYWNFFEIIIEGFNPQ